MLLVRKCEPNIDVKYRPCDVYFPIAEHDGNFIFYQNYGQDYVLYENGLFRAKTTTFQGKFEEKDSEFIVKTPFYLDKRENDDKDHQTKNSKNKENDKKDENLLITKTQF